MDNIIQILVFLFIIYAILSPILSKRKRGQVNNNPDPNNFNGDADIPKASPKNSSYDVLEDFLGFKIPKTDNGYSQNNFPQKNDNYDLKTVDYETEFQAEYKNLETDTKMPVVNFDILPALNSISPIIESPFLGSSVISSVNLNVRAVAIKNRFKDKLELRDVILITEILNKPKALRR